MQRLAYISIVAIVLSYAFGLVLGTYIPVTVHDPDCLPQKNQKIESKGYYTPNELDHAEAEVKRRLECLREKTRKKSTHQFFLDAREGGKWLTWLPWLAVPLLAKLRSYKTALAPAAILIVLAGLGIFKAEESVLSIAALALGVALIRSKRINARSDA